VHTGIIHIIMHKAKFQTGDEFLTTAPAAREIGVSAQTVIQWERDGKLPAIKTATGMRLFRREDIERLKAQREEKKRA
jgi:excisionase family DNA binding protein